MRISRIFFPGGEGVRGLFSVILLSEFNKGGSGPPPSPLDPRMQSVNPLKDLSLVSNQKDISTITCTIPNLWSLC